MPLLDPESRDNLDELVDAMAAAVTAFLTGLPADGEGDVEVHPTSVSGLPPVTAAYWAGRLAADVGAAKAATTTPEAFDQWLKKTASDLDDADVKSIHGANEETAKWVQGRAEALKQRLRALIEKAEAEYDRDVAENPDLKDDEAFHDRSLADLSDDVDETGQTWTNDLHRITQTGFLTLLQRAYALSQKGDPWCFKIPRPTACEYCLELHLDPDGSYTKYRLSEIRGNSNVGAKPEEWTFVIGATHPHCYCQFYVETDPTAPDPDQPNKTLAEAKSRSLEKNLTGVPLPKLDPLIPHEKVFLTELRKIFGTLEKY